MFARNMSVKFDISACNFGDSCLMLMMPVFYLADLIYSPQNVSPVLHSEYAGLDEVAILFRDRMWI